MLIPKFVAAADRFPRDIRALHPWQVIGNTEALVREALDALPDGFRRFGQVAVHRSAVVDGSAVLTGPVIVSAGCRIGPGALLRAGTWVDEDVTVGPHSEVKGSLIFTRSAAAHRNYVGDSIIGQDVNLEAGAVLANHFNERTDKRISVRVDGQGIIPTGLTKFGAVLGDGTRIGANAVTTPGTLLPPQSIVPRLGLIDQLADTPTCNTCFNTGRHIR
jgi:UDP-N-acetylglucosamine diphosphorylase / glucose-1-phosphate thymidylyltransferase / UDP-N-acetylgalactosamine diphosphorylase / glucosamine-1-phosphate N-acetyltransferase / galactosamine-1-phosphate N-acetyltransferase